MAIRLFIWVIILGEDGQIENWLSALGMTTLLRRYFSLIVLIFFCLKLVLLCLRFRLNAFWNFKKVSDAKKAAQ
jgi:ABC-type spermidine/putrescine transport system permease subunit I